MTFPSTIHQSEWDVAYVRFIERLAVNDAQKVAAQYPKPADPSVHTPSKIELDEVVREKWRVLVWDKYGIDVEPISFEALDLQGKVNQKN